MPEKQKRGNVRKLVDRIALSLRLMLDRRIDASYKLIPPLALLYVLSPVDAIPELLFGPFGLVDDVGVALVALEVFIRMAPPEIVREHMNVLKGHSGKTRDDYFEADVIEGEYFISKKPEK